MRLALAALAAVSATTLFPLAPAHAVACSVTVQFSGYAPNPRTVAPGTTVHWCWNESNHSVTSNTGAFDSGVRDNGATFDHLFTTSGTYTYHCTVHDSMVATIVVKTGGTPSPTHTTTPPHPSPSKTATSTPRPATSSPAARTSPPPRRTTPPVAPVTTSPPAARPLAGGTPTPVLTAPASPTATAVADEPAASKRSYTTPLVVLLAVLVIGAGALFGIRGRTAR